MLRMYSVHNFTTSQLHNSWPGLESTAGVGGGEGLEIARGTAAIARGRRVRRNGSGSPLISENRSSAISRGRGRFSLSQAPK